MNMKMIPESPRERYVAPVAVVLGLVSGGALCESSYVSGEIPPAETESWGIIN